MTGNPAKLRALALAFPRTHPHETWLPVSGCCAFMSGNAFVLAGSLSAPSPPLPLLRVSVSPPSQAENNPGVCVRDTVTVRRVTAWLSVSVGVLLLAAVCEVQTGLASRQPVWLVGSSEVKPPSAGCIETDLPLLNCVF